MMQLRPAILAIMPLFLGAASQSPGPPGEGVLCIGTMIYAVDLAGRTCHAGQDVEFQDRIAGYASRLDQYILRNTGGDPKILQKFKEGQGVALGSHPDICRSKDIEDLYQSFRKHMAPEIENGVEQALARDGKPTFGDCI